MHSLDEWISPVATGTWPQPCDSFTLDPVATDRAVLFAGNESNSKVYYCNFRKDSAVSHSLSNFSPLHSLSLSLSLSFSLFLSLSLSLTLHTLLCLYVCVFLIYDMRVIIYSFLFAMTYNMSSGLL